MSDRQLVREQVSVPEAYEMLELGHVPADRKVLCPFHEEHTPSCHLYDDHFSCFACGANGDVAWFVAKVTGSSLSKAERFLLGAVDELSTSARVIVPKVRPVLDLTAKWNAVTDAGEMLRDMARILIKNRWPILTLEKLETAGWKVGRDGLWIPHWYRQKVVGIKVRTWNGGKAAVKGSTFTLSPYVPETQRNGIPLVVCEGEPDTVAMTFAVSAYVIGMPSGAAAALGVVADCIIKSAGSPQVFLAFDADDAGRTASAQLAGRLSAAGVSCVDLTRAMEPYGADVCDALAGGWRPSV